MKKQFLSFALVAIVYNLASAQSFVPKYGPEGSPKAILLKKERTFVQTKPAPDFWALIPYYEGMKSAHSASAVSVAMVLNGLKQNTKYSAANELVTEKDLLKKVSPTTWSVKLEGDKPVGVNLVELGALLQASLKTYNVPKAKVKVINVIDQSADTLAKVRKLLIENELSDTNFLIANYLQSAFTNDPEGAVGTYSVVAAFDEAADRVLILETDRKYYEPYWVSIHTFMDGLSGIKNAKGASTGGLVWVTNG